jgi:hypothetical protein
VRQELELRIAYSPEVRAVWDHWLSLASQGEPPLRRQLDATAMAGSLPYIWIVEKQLDQPHRFLLRLAGEAINALFGESLRLRFIDQIFPPPIAGEVERKLDTVMESRAVVWTLGPFFESQPNGPSGECLVAPITGDGPCQGALGVTVPRHALRTPPRRLFPICQEKLVITAAEWAALQKT